MQSARKNKLKIVFFIDRLNGKVGGAERVTVDLANALHNDGYLVTVCTYQTDSAPSFFSIEPGIRRIDLRKRKLDIDLEPEFLPRLGLVLERSGLPLLGWLLRYTAKLRAYLTAVRQFRPDVMFGVMPSSFSIITLIGKLTRVKAVCMIHNDPNREFGADLHRWDQNKYDIKLRKWAVAHSFKNVVLMESFIGAMPRRARDRTVVIPNIVALSNNNSQLRSPARPFDLNISRNRDVAAFFEEESQAKVVLYLGRLSRAKRIDILLRAWAESRHVTSPDWVLLVVGHGPEAPELKRLRSSLGLDGSCFFAPSTKDVEAYYRRSEMFVIPSTFEGFGLVTAEALSRALPVVGYSSCPGTNTLVNDGVNGILVRDVGLDEDDPKRVSLLAESIQQLIVDGALRARMSSRAPGTVEKFSESNILPMWRDLLQGVNGNA